MAEEAAYQQWKEKEKQWKRRIERWQYVIALEATQEEQREFVATRFYEYTFQWGLSGSDLWDQFRSDFKDFSDIFQTLGARRLRAIRTDLRRHQVFVPYFDLPRSLLLVLEEEQQHVWSDDEVLEEALNQAKRKRFEHACKVLLPKPQVKPKLQVKSKNAFTQRTIQPANQPTIAQVALKDSQALQRDPQALQLRNFFFYNFLLPAQNRWKIILSTLWLWGTTIGRCGIG
ncbi:hypothetical protein B0O99DRAFT_615216 [Bisporella sp. PMI_857]|nr:hypothetical protein B0O99DRAFT_615216 [Bisporella sp. PMI_857]